MHGLNSASPPRTSSAAVADRSAGPSGAQGATDTPGPPIPSPPPPPFGYCGGLNSVVDARYLTTRGQAVALVTATITGPGQPDPAIPVERQLPVSHVHVLAGHVPGGSWRSVDYQLVKPGRYLILVGGLTSAHHYPALGAYGIFAIKGGHAYRTCYPFTTMPPRPHRVTNGITTISGLTRLFAAALAVSR